MSDDGDTPPDDEITSARRPSPNPASRARRIGGRPTPSAAPRPTPDGSPAATVSTETPAPPKPKSPRPSLTKAERPAPVAKAAVPTESEPESAATGRRGAPLQWLPAGVLALAAVVMLVVVAIASHGVYWAKPDNSASARAAKQEQVLASVKKCFADINSYDYRKLTGLVAKDVACTTGKFTADLKRTLQTQIIPLAPKVKATQTAQVNRAGVVSVSSDGTQWVALIYGQLNQSNTSTAKTPRIDVVGAVVTVDKVGSRWLISKVASDVGTSLGS